MNQENFDVLFVDDDINILKAMKRNFHEQFSIATASTIDEALNLLNDHQFPIVISDMKMPEMNGADLLIYVKQKSPDTIRVLLTGESGLPEAIKAINESDIYKFLTKPCPPEALRKTIESAITLYHAKYIERNILDKTVKSFVYILLEIINQISPEIFKKSLYIAKIIKSSKTKFNVKDRWSTEIASLLMFVGTIHLKIYNFSSIYGTQTLVDIINKSAQLTGKVQKFENVQKILTLLARHYQTGIPIKALDSDDKILKFVIDYCVLIKDSQFQKKISRMYSDEILHSIPTLFGIEKKPQTEVSLRADELKSGMIAAEKIVTGSGSVIMEKGEELTETHVSTLQIFTSKSILQEPFKMLVQ